MEHIIIDNAAIGKRLRALRGKMTLEELSQATGIGRSALNMYELGSRMPRDEAKIKLANFFGVSVERIFYAGNDTICGVDGPKNDTTESA